MKVRGVYVVRAQGRRVNSGVNRVCAHGGRASRHQAMRSARSGWAGEGRPACSVSRVAVPERCGGADARSVRGPGCRAQEEGLRASVCAQDICACRSLGVGRGTYSPRVPPLGPRVRLPSLPLLCCSSAGLPPLASTGAGLPAATPPLQCRRHLPRAGAALHGSGAPRGPAAEWSSAAVRARSQEPAARSLALARLPARPLLLEFKVTSALSTPGSGAAQ